MKSNNNEQCNLLTIGTPPELKVRHKTAEGSPKGGIIFVHGICHGAWCFEKFMDFFSENGYECFALNLRGHGDNNRNDLNGARLSDYTDDVKRCVDYCTDYCNKQGITEKPFLLGHSMGGAVVQKYIGAYSDTVKGAILFASATGGGMDFGKTLKDSFTHKNLFTATLVANLGTRLLTLNAIYKSAFFDERIDKERSKIYKESLHKESIKITFIDLYQEYTKNYNVDIPILVIGSYADSYFPEESLLKTARVYGCTENDAKRNLKILPDLCHDMMLDEVDEGWKKSAKAVLDFMKNNK